MHFLGFGLSTISLWKLMLRCWRKITWDGLSTILSFWHELITSGNVKCNQLPNPNHQAWPWENHSSPFKSTLWTFIWEFFLLYLGDCELCLSLLLLSLRMTAVFCSCFCWNTFWCACEFRESLNFRENFLHANISCYTVSLSKCTMQSPGLCFSEKHMFDFFSSAQPSPHVPL